MNEITTKNNDFMDVYNKSYRLAAAVFMVSNVIEENEELRTKIKTLSLRLVSTVVNLKDLNFSDTKKLITDLEKNSLELVSMLDIAAVAGLVSKMNVGIIRDEFQSFITEIKRFSADFESHKSTSVKDVFSQSPFVSGEVSPNKIEAGYGSPADLVSKNEPKNILTNDKNKDKINHNGHRRKDLRKSTIFDFIKGHNDVSIKDITPNITGCSEKTIQRELIVLINEGKIRKSGERRWSRYSVV